MSRVKRGIVTKKRHKRLLQKTKGFWGQRANVFRRAKETLMRAMAFAYVGRRLKKRDFRRLFVVRINAACRQNGLTYNRFVHGCKQFGTLLNRKMLSQLAVYDAPVFNALLENIKQNITA